MQSASEAAHLTPDRERGCRARWALQHLSLHVLRQPSSAAPPAWLPRNPPAPNDLHQPEPSGPGPGLSPPSPSPGDLIIPLSCISVDDPRLYFPTSDPFLSFIVECPPVSLGRRHRGVAWAGVGSLYQSSSDGAPSSHARGAARPHPPSFFM